MKRRVGVLVTALFLIIMMMISACSSNGQQGAEGNAGPGDATNTGASTDLEITKIKIIDFSDSIHVGTIKLAQNLGFFEKEGLTIDVLSTAGGAQSAPAVLSGDVYFAEIAYSHVFKFKQRNQPLIALGQTMDDLGIFVSYSEEWMKKTGINADSTLEEKVLALKDARIGVTSVGSLTDEVIRYFLKRFNLNPERDVMITGVGGNNLLTALEAGSIDISVGFSHFPEYIEQKGLGQALIRTRDIPELQNISNIVIAANEEWAKKHPNTVKAFMRALSNTVTYMKSNQESAVEAAQTAWPAIPAEVIEKATEHRVEVTPDTLKIPEEGAKRNLQWLLDAGTLTEPLDVTITYDNSYLPE